jgi:hypothetical protein
MIGAVLPLGRRIQLFLSGLGLTILICDLFLRPDIRHLDGSSGSINTDTALSLLNASLFIGLPLLLFFFVRSLESFLLIFLLYPFFGCGDNNLHRCGVLG